MLYNGWSYGFVKDCVNVFVDRDIVLYGVCFFGWENSSYWVDLEIKNVMNKVVLMFKVGWFLFEIL